MKSIRVLSHTSDIRLLIKSNSRHELFRAGILGLAKIISPAVREKKYTISKKIRVESLDLTTLFIDMLNEVLSLNHVNKCVFDDINSLEIFDERAVEIELNGYPVNKFIKDVKAVTYHEAEIRQSSLGILQIVVILDI
ncbi:MAG: archease [Cyclobacteriaceae bacterium]|nr:archease [Cyclobacteriaceae bacterium]